MKKLHILIIVLLISLSICAFQSMQVKGQSVPPTVSVSPSSWTMDVGQSKSFTAAASGGSGSYSSYQWYVGGSLQPGASASTFSYSPGSPGSYSITVTVTDTLGATSGPSDAVPIAVKAVPTVTVSTSSGTMDIGQSQSVTATASGGSGIYSSYKWYVDLSLQSSTTSSFTYSPGSTAGSHSITVTVTDSLGATSAMSSPATVTVNSAPSISVQPSSATIDSGQSATLTAKVTGGTGSFSWQWFNSGGSISGASGTGVTATHVFNAAAAGIYVIFNDTGTGASYPAVSVASGPVVTVTVNPALVAPIVSASLSTLSQGQTSSLTSSVVTTGTTPYTFQWLQKAPGAGVYSLINGATSSSYSFITSVSTIIGSWSFELQVTDAASAIVTSNPVSVLVNSVPIVSVTPVGPLTMDVGQVQMFTATGSGGSGSLTYQWYLDSTAVPSATGLSYSYTAGGSSHSITCKVTDSAPTPVTSVSNVVSITVNVAPSVSVAPAIWTMDVGQSETFTATASGGSGSLSYQWFLSGSPVSGQTGANYVFTAVSAGTPTIYCKVTDHASTPFIVQSNSPSVTVNSALVAPIVSASLSTLSQGQTSSLTSSVVSAGTSPYSYQWLSRAPGAGSYVLISGATSSSYSFATSISTATGSWSFILRVTDSAGAVANSAAVSVAVNIPPLDHFIFSPIGTQTAGTPFTIVVTAKDASNNTLTNYVGTNVLSVSTGTISPVSTGAFSKGVWSGSVTVTGANSGVTLFATGSGMSGTSNSFTVNSGSLNRFNFNPVSSPQTSGSAFSITVTANDVYGNIVAGYVGGPSLSVSSGSISPSNMAAFVNGVGSTSVTLTGSGSGVTITATDSLCTGVSNTFTLTDAPTPVPTSTPSPTQGAFPTSTPTSTSTPKVTPTPTATPSPTPIPTIKGTITAQTDNGGTVNLAISGNITSSQIFNIALTSSQSNNSTTLSMIVMGDSGSTGFSNITIPKTAVLYGTKPVVLIDGQQASNQGYAQDKNNFYVWFAAQFSAHLIKVQFGSPLTSQASSFEPLLVVGIVAPEIILIYTVIAVRRLRRRPENA